jgi:hypothetical protein
MGEFDIKKVEARADPVVLRKTTNVIGGKIFQEVVVYILIFDHDRLDADKITVSLKVVMMRFVTNHIFTASGLIRN